jgi:urease accessory protein
VIAGGPGPQQDGLLELRAAPDPRGRTYLAERHQRFPLRITVPMYLDAADPGMAYCYVQNPTGGVFAGDQLTERLVVEPGARLHVTSQSATKLYRMEGGRAHQRVVCRVSAGAVLERVPDTLIPQAGSHFVQHTEVDVEDGAVFVSADTVAPGRIAYGERFEYELLELRVEVRQGSRPLCVETLRLEPGRRSPGRHGLLGPSDYVASMLVLAPGRDGEALAAEIDAELAGLTGARGGAGALNHGAGAVVRIMAGSAPGVRHALRAAWATARRQLLGLPLPRERK